MACKCNVSLSNTGLPNCEPIASVTKKIILVPYYDNSGNVNSIDLTATLNQVYFTGKINAADASQRWYPLPEIKNVTEEKTDSIFESFDDGTQAFIREGNRSFSGIMPSKSPAFLEKIKEYRCATIGAYLIDKDGNLIGASIEAGYLYPIKIDQTSWDARLVKATDSTIQKIQLTFSFHVDERDEDLRMITADEVSPVRLLSLAGLLDVNAEYTNESTTGFDAKLYTDFGSVLNPITVKGLVLGDFALYNETDAAAVTISSVTENNGTYSFTFAAQTSGDVLTLTPTKNGYDFKNVVAATILIP